MSSHEQYDLPSRNDIEDETDLDLLADWRLDAEDTVDAIEAQLAAWRTIGKVDADWERRAAGKLTVAYICLRRLDRRVAALKGAVSR